MPGAPAVVTAKVNWYNANGLYNLAKDAGFDDSQATIMAGIALAESQGNPNAHNPKPPDDSYGLWQINMIGKNGPERRAWFGISNNKQLFDPKTNARAAKIIYDKQGFKAWSTYNNGHYKTAVDQAGVTGAAHVPLVNSVGNPLDAVGKAIVKLGADMATVIVIVALLVIGVVFLLRKPISAVAGATPIGRATKIVSKVAG